MRLQNDQLCADCFATERSHSDEGVYSIGIRFTKRIFIFFSRGEKNLSRVTVNQHFLEQYLRLDTNRKTPPMQPTLANLEINILEKMYLAEMETLKLKLLTGAFWKDIKRQKDKTLELAHTIHEKQFGNLALSLG
jgi:hypothetical protein